MVGICWKQFVGIGTGSFFFVYTQQTIEVNSSEGYYRLRGYFFLSRRIERKRKIEKERERGIKGQVLK